MSLRMDGKCPKHPAYDGGRGCNWNCRACREVRKAASVQAVTDEQYAKYIQPARPALRERYEPSLSKKEIEFETTLQVHNLDDLIRACKIDTNIWEIRTWTISASSTGKGQRVSASLRRRQPLAAARQEIEELKRLAKEGLPRLRTTGTSGCKSCASGLMLEINIPDLHVGKLAWSFESGWPDYDGDIAVALFEDALATLLERTVSYKFEQIILPLGNDILHSDTKFGTTTSGTQLDTDSRYQKNFARVRNLAVRAAERLRDIAPTTVIMVPGNHDTLSVWHLGDSLECFYHDTPRITIDNSPCLRKYHQFGKVMLLFAHGDKGKLQDYPLLMATEKSSTFGATTHREAHVGHLHKTKVITTLSVQEHHGVRVRIIPSLCAPDAWHSEHAFVANQRSAEAFIWHKDEGLIGTAIYNVKEGK